MTIFRICPRCRTRWADEKIWELDCRRVEVEEREIQIRTRTGGHLQPLTKTVLRLEVREHAGCGGQMYSAGCYWDHKRQTWVKPYNHGSPHVTTGLKKNRLPLV